MASVSRDTDNRHRNESVLVSRSSSVDSKRPLPFISGSSYTPQIIAAARDRQRNLAIEVLGPNHKLVFPSPEPSEVDRQDLGRLSGISELSEEPPRVLDDVTAKPLPSPLAAHPPKPTGAISNIDNSLKKVISPPVAASNSLGFTSKARERAASPPMKGITSPRVSMFIEDLEGKIDASNRPGPVQEAQQDGAKFNGWPLTSPSASPTPGSHADKSSTFSRSETPRVDGEPPKQAISNATVVSPQARKGSLLPKFLRSKSPERNQIETTVGNQKGAETTQLEKPTTIEEQSSPEQAVSPQSFFDDESSDGGDVSQVESAQHAVIANPIVVDNGSVTKVGLKEMLRSTPPVEDSFSGEQTVRLISPNSNGANARPRNHNEHANTGASKNTAHGTGLWKEINPFTPSPSRTAPPAPSTKDSNPSSKPKQPRTVSFPPPAPLDIQPGHLFLRQSVVSTPYPSELDEKHQKRTTSGPNGKSRKDTTPETVLTLILTGNKSLAPKVKRIAIPINPQQTRHPGATEKPNPSSPDDEYLFKLIRKNYTAMRGGRLRSLLSARTVTSLSFHPYTSLSHLLSHTTNTLPPTLPDETSPSPSPSLHTLFHHPSTGRSHKTYTTLLTHPPTPTSRHPSTTSSAPGISPLTTPPTATPQPQPQHLALLLHTTVSPKPLLLSLFTTLALSILTTLLWIFFGTASTPFPHTTTHSHSPTTLNLTDAFGASAQVSQGGNGTAGGEAGIGGFGGYRGAGERVGSGALLGMLVLGLGWTGVAAVGVMSWLVL
ncbi:hypothetical protein ACLMJK_007389 [Lecanora helva]